MQDIARIKLDLRLGRFIVSEHAKQRMIQRHVRYEDLKEIGFNCYFHAQQGESKYRLDGYDLDGDPLSVVVFYDGDSVIITVMDTPERKQGARG